MARHIDILRRLRPCYPAVTSRSLQQRGGREESRLEALAVWEEVDRALAEADAPPSSTPRCCYCGSDTPKGSWVMIGGNRFSCGGRDCVAF